MSSSDLSTSILAAGPHSQQMGEEEESHSVGCSRVEGRSKAREPVMEAPSLRSSRVRSTRDPVTVTVRSSSVADSGSGSQESCDLPGETVSRATQASRAESSADEEEEQKLKKQYEN